MLGIWDDIANYFHDQGIGTFGVDIKVAELPPEPHNCIAIFGLLGFEKPNIDIADFIYPRFQVIVRNQDYEAGLQKLLDIREALHNKYGLLTLNYYILRCNAEQEGGPIGKDDEGRFEFSINFNLQARTAVPGDSAP